MSTRALHGNSQCRRAGQREGLHCLWISHPAGFCEEKTQDRERLPDFSGSFARQIPWDPVDLETLTWRLVANPISKVWLLLYPLW